MLGRPQLHALYCCPPQAGDATTGILNLNLIYPPECGASTAAPGSILSALSEQV